MDHEVTDPATGGDSTQGVEVVVGRVGRAHGVRGDVTVEVRTDDPELRFASTALLRTDRTGPMSQLVVERRRWHSGRLLVHFEGVDDRAAAEALRGALLSVELDPDERPDDPEEFYDHQLVGLTVVDQAGAELGAVSDVVHGAQDLLVVSRATGGEALVPFVRALVPEIDLVGRRLVTNLPVGLLDLSSG